MLRAWTQEGGLSSTSEAGCSANEIAAISGHTSLSEVQRYTKAADQARMAQRDGAASKDEKEAAD